MGTYELRHDDRMLHHSDHKEATTQLTRLHTQSKYKVQERHLR